MIDKIISELNIEINIKENKIIFNINDKNIGYFIIYQINYISIKNLNNIKIINNPIMIRIYLYLLYINKIITIVNIIII